jgi:hypothetical protein
VGLSLPAPPSRRQLRPYATTGLQWRTGLPDARQLKAGLEAKYGLATDLNLDATVNTDFAQAEVDQDRINLTRYSLYFPEKREFF